MEQAVQIFAILHFLVIGVSHFVQPGTIYFVFPAVGLRLVEGDRARRFFAPGGLLFIALAGLLAYHLLSLPPHV